MCEKPHLSFEKQDKESTNNGKSLTERIPVLKDQAPLKTPSKEQNKKPVVTPISSIADENKHSSVIIGVNHFPAAAILPLTAKSPPNSNKTKNGTVEREL